MKERDPLSQLLQNWQPKCPIDNQKFAYDVMRRIRQAKTEPFWKRAIATWSEVLDEWLPSPGILVPVAASLVLFLGVIQWTFKAEQQAKTLAALQWHEQVAKPLAKQSLAGTYVQLTRK
jgi:hypothetical protein